MVVALAAASEARSAPLCLGARAEPPILLFSRRREPGGGPPPPSAMIARGVHRIRARLLIWAAPRLIEPARISVDTYCTGPGRPVWKVRLCQLWAGVAAGGRGQPPRVSTAATERNASQAGGATHALVVLVQCSVCCMRTRAPHTHDACRMHGAGRISRHRAGHRAVEVRRPARPRLVRQ